MAKKIVDENGNVFVQKKPIYKRIWFWLLAIIVIAIVLSVSGGNKETPTTSKTETAQTKASSGTSNKPKVSAEFTAALFKAKTYGTTMSMSKDGIYDQLTSEAGEKFPTDAAQYAIDNVNVDYNKNALSKAKTYQKDMSMATDAIRDQLTSSAGEKFTPEQAEYAIQHLND
ncbi:Ltp family lipoprotein [Leuconostoc gelidum subsp. gasicomitatum]|uniref:Ltp family lipoprotein n=1 Tax=Leuconostoc gasicomitatum TaxID=115778 RepID=UPI001CC48AD8|nr:Ltp family lipoprotein [Leuconostoc gasicomitatum]MBZ5952878.1 Ltp family lipoprotein [Leuconostoc gasicomitatum]